MLPFVDAPPSSPSPPSSSSPSPYRAEKPLDQIIPPDRRREKTIALVIASMVAGIAVWTLGGWAIDALRACHGESPPPPPPAFVSGRITSAVLAGPGGTTRVPLPQMHVVNVWLQGCADCMPAFEAMRDLQDRGGLGLHVPVLNVAYGEADQTWAHRYGVGGDLYFDATGTVFVKPLGIGSFTTLVVDAQGNVIHRDRPDRPGFRERILAAVGESEPEGDPLAIAPPKTDRPSFDSAAVESVVASHRTGVKRTCWERGQGADVDKAESASINVSVRLAPDGSVESTSSSGVTPADRAVGTCVEKQIRGWRFPAPGTSTTVTIPFRFFRQ